RTTGDPDPEVPDVRGRRRGRLRGDRGGGRRAEAASARRLEAAHKAFRVELNAHVAELLIGSGAQRLQEIEAATRRRFFVVGRDGVSSEHFTVLEEGTLDKLAPVEAPVAEGQTIDLRLVEVGRHDA